MPTTIAFEATSAVPQDDIIHGDLTVGQALYYTARLRLPSDFSDPEIATRIETVLDQLGLAGTEDALMVMRVLRKLADAGKTILLTIHQPSAEVFRLMDNLVVIGKDPQSAQPGRLAYYGPAYPDAIRFFNPDPPGDAARDPSPDEALRGMARRPLGDWLLRYASSDYRKRFVDERRGEQPAADTSAALPSAREAVPHTTGITQWSTLTRRCLSIILRDSWNSALLLAQAPIIAVLLVLVFGQQAAQDLAGTAVRAEAQRPLQVNPQQWQSAARATSTMVFLMALSALWFGCSNSARAIVSEWPIYRRERMVNLKIPSYIASKQTVFGALCAVQCAVLLGIVHWGGGLRGAWPQMFAVLLLSSVVGVAIGLAVSSVARSSEVAIALLPIVILPMVILGGVLQPIHAMGPASGWLCQVMPSRWAFESLLVIEAQGRPQWQQPALPDADSISPAEAVSAPPSQTLRQIDMAEVFFPKHGQRRGVRTAALVLIAMLVLLAAATWAILRARDLR